MTEYTIIATGRKGHDCITTHTPSEQIARKLVKRYVRQGYKVELISPVTVISAEVRDDLDAYCDFMDQVIES
jgi:hypothetical protein